MNNGKDENNIIANNEHEADNNIHDKNLSNDLISRFILLNVSTGIAIGMMEFIIPIYALSINATQTEIGLIKGISGIGDLIIVLPAGILVDYLGTKKLYSIGCFLGIVIISLLSLAKTPTVLLFMMLLFGATRTFRTTSLSAEFFKNINIIGYKKGGLYRGSMTIGVGFIGPLVGGLIATYINFSYYFIISGMLLIIPIMIMRSFTNFEDINNKKNFNIVEKSTQYKDLIKDKKLIRSTVIECTNIAFLMTFSAFMTIYMIKDLSLSTGIVATVQSLKGGVTILVVLFGGVLLRENNDKLYIFSYIISILGIIVLGYATDIITIGVVSIILGIAAGLISIGTITDVSNVKDYQKGKIAGIFSLGFGLGSITGPTFGGIIGDIFGMQAIFLSFIPIFIVACLYILKDYKIKDYKINIKNTKI